MKNIKRAIIIIVSILLFFSFFSHNGISDTTIGNTTISADVGKTYTWKMTYPSEASGVKFAYTFESIEKGVHNTVDALLAYCTIQVYYPGLGWNTWVNNTLYLAANETQKYLAFGSSMGGPVVIPTPINLTLVAETFDEFFVSNSSIVDNTIIFNYINGNTYEYTFNTEGFLTIGIAKEGGIMVSKWVFDTGDKDEIPLGNYFLIFVIISVIALVYLKKQKIK
ncbi:MAG: hypothetical protein ACFE9T_14095 [Promethearchaeota archaeon]